MKTNIYQCNNITITCITVHCLYQLQVIEIVNFIKVGLESHLVEQLILISIVDFMVPYIVWSVYFIFLHSFFFEKIPPSKK